MKKLIYITLILLCFACKQKKQIEKKEIKETITNKVIKSEFQALIDSNNVKGSILIYNLNENTYYSNDFEWAEKGNLPASTFKIPNSIIGLETNVIENENALFKWDGEKKWLKVWEQDLRLKDAFQFSCVPCYQQIAREVGPDRMNNYVAKLNYGDLRIDSTNIDKFWLEGESKISQMQQINFLKRFYKSELPISKRTSEIVKNIMLIETKEQYKLSGKTGLSNNNQIYNGWFVGYVELPENTYLFATNIESQKEIELNTFIKKRIDLTQNAFKIMNVFH